MEHVSYSKSLSNRLSTQSKGWWNLCWEEGAPGLPGALVSQESPELFSFRLHTPQVYHLPLLWDNSWLCDLEPSSLLLEGRDPL